MPDHPSWPAELVEKAARAICDQGVMTLNGEIGTWERHADGFHHMAQAVLSALSGDLVPREERDNAVSWIAPLRDKAAQADALAEALERIVGDKTPVADFHFAGRADDREDAMIEIARSALASYRSSSSTEEKVHPNNEDV